MKIIELLRARNADPMNHRPVTICCLGDSVTHGCFDLCQSQTNAVDTRYAPGEGYVRRLEDRLFRLFPAAAVAVINCGVGGDTSVGALARFDRDVARFQPDMVIVDLGLNDSGNPDVEAGLAAYAASMRGIFDKSLALGAEVILLTPNRMCAYVDLRLPEGLPRTIAEHLAKVQTTGVLTRYVDAARRIAGELSIPVSDAYAVWEQMEAAGADTTALLANHINHPDPEMHDVFVAELLRTMFA